MKHKSLVALAASALVTTLAHAQPTSIDLSNYVRVARYALPEPILTSAPAGNVLAQEASGVAYNRDTDSLFIIGDGGTNITQVSKTGALIDTMTLAAGSSPQGTAFYDPEGITYIGGGKFVFVEERYRQANLVTYVAGTTLSSAQSVKLGTTIGNIGLEGLSYDPATGGYIFVKESGPQGIFQTTLNFNNGTASNGSAVTANSTNLFNPALLGVADIADVFALSNIDSIVGQSQYNNLLVLSQESGKLLNVDRAGNIASSLTLTSDAGDLIALADMQPEGITMDQNGNIYIVTENGGGDINHPQLWVYSAIPEPSTYAACAGLFTLGFTSFMRRRKKSAAV